jgi:hypothetical protein
MELLSEHSLLETRLYKISYGTFMVNALLYPTFKFAGAAANNSSTFATLQVLATLTFTIGLAAASYLLFYMLKPIIDQNIHNTEWRRVHLVRQAQIDHDVAMLKRELNDSAALNSWLSNGSSSEKD